MKTIGFQCGQYTRHQPEGGRGDLQLTLKNALQPLHLGEGDGTPTPARKRTLTHQLGKGRVNRLRGSKKRVVSQAVETRTRGEDAGHRARTASISLRTRGHFFLNLRHTGVQTVTAPGGGRFRLTKPRLKTATRSLGFSQRTRGWAHLMNQGHQTRMGRVNCRRDRLGLALVRFRTRRIGVRTVSNAVRRNPT